MKVAKAILEWSVFIVSIVCLVVYGFFVEPKPRDVMVTVILALEALSIARGNHEHK